MKNNKTPAFYVLGQPISGSIWGMVLKCCNGDREQCSRIFYRAKCANAKNVVAWIRAGLKPGPKSEPPYARTAHASEIDNAPAARQWIDATIFKIVPAKMNDMIREFALSILQGIN